MSFKFVLFKCIAFGYFITFGASSCPAGYFWHSGGCYLIVGLNVTWIDARKYCEVLGGTLLSIESSATQSSTELAVRRVQGTMFPGKFWLDFSDLLNPKDWKRMRDHNALEYENWQPAVGLTSAKTEVHNCVYMDKDNRWSTEHCGEKMNFVCYALGSTEENSIPKVKHTAQESVDESEEVVTFDPFGWF